LTPCRRAPQDLGLYLVHLQPVGFHPPQHIVDTDRHTLCQIVSVGRLTKPAYLCVVDYIPSVFAIVLVLGLEMSSRTNFESLALALKVKSLYTTLHHNRHNLKLTGNRKF